MGQTKTIEINKKKHCQRGNIQINNMIVISNMSKRLLWISVFFSADYKGNLSFSDTKLITICLIRNYYNLQLLIRCWLRDSFDSEIQAECKLL